VRIVRETGQRVTLSGVRDAYFNGEFEACIALAEEFRARSAEDATEVTFLRARSLLALNRQDQALETVRNLRLSDRPLDEYLTAQLLLGAAYVALGQTKPGLDILARAQAAASDAHPTVQAELRVFHAQALYRLKRLDEAQRLLDEVPSTADIIYARALEYSGWIALAREEFPVAVERFRAALRCIDGCRRYDRFVESKALYGLAFLCGELPRLDLWPEVRERALRFDWTVSGVAVWRYWFALEASFATEMRGELAASVQWATLAEDVAPSESCRIIAWCRLAARLGRYGEYGAHAYFLTRARAAYDRLARDGRLLDEPSLSLTLAEEFVHGGSPEDAAALLTYYAQTVVPGRLGNPDEATLETTRLLVQGQLEESRGERAHAEANYKQALARFQGHGFHRRAALVAYRLAALTGDERYYDFVSSALHDAHDAYWVKQNIARSRLTMRLSDRQATVLRLVSEGKTNKEIASVCGVSFFTARNTVRELLRILDARTRGDLSAIAVARGVAFR